MHQLLFRLLAYLAIFNLTGQAFAENYNFSHGYIFEQPYVKRITEAKSDEILGKKNILENYKSGTWPREATDGKVVIRKGNLLTIKFDKKEPLTLKNYTFLGNRNEEGDSQRFTFIKSIGTYHIIGVAFGHDQPGFLLVEKSSGIIFFVDTN